LFERGFVSLVALFGGWIFMFIANSEARYQK